MAAPVTPQRDASAGPGDRLGAALFDGVLLALGLLVVAGSYQLGLGRRGEPGAGLFPFFAGLAIALPQLVVLFNSFARTSDNPEFRLSAGSLKTLLVLLAIFGGWIVIMPLLGYLIVTFLAVVAFAKTLRLEGWAKPLALAAGASLGVYILFDRLLFLDLPRGPLG